MDNGVFLRSVLRLKVMANVPSSPILVTLMMEALSSSETSGPTRRNIPEDAILLSYSLFSHLRLDLPRGISHLRLDLPRGILRARLISSRVLHVLSRARHSGFSQ
jgi:hypothetical protein